MSVRPGGGRVRNHGGSRECRSEHSMSVRPGGGSARNHAGARERRNEHSVSVGPGSGCGSMGGNVGPANAEKETA